jgi:hypothetical protein
MAYFQGGNVKVLRLDNSSTFTQIGGQASCALPVSNGNAMRITATGVGSSVQLDLSYAGVTVLTVTDSTASRITTLGSAGVYFEEAGSDTQYAHISAITLTDAAASSSLTLTSPAAGRIFQRVGTTGVISVTGTYSGSPASIEARLVLDGTNTAVSGFDWSTKVAGPSGNAFSFNFASVPEGAWYNVQIRDSAVPGAVVASGKVGVGVLVPLIGQSNAWLWFARGDSSLTPDPKLRVIGSGSDNGIASANVSKTWQVPASATMNGAIACGNRLVSLLGTLVALIDVTWDGSGLTLAGNGGQWLPTVTAGHPYARAKAFLQTITSAIEAAIIVNGETDAANGVSQATFYAGMGTLISTLRTDFGTATTPIITPLLGKRTDGLVTDVQAQAVRNAQVQKAGDTAVYRVEREDLTRNADGVHLDAPGFTKLGQRCAQALAYALGAATYYRGPRMTSVVQISSIVYDGILAHSGGSDFAPTSGITGFRALDGSTPIAISSVVRQAANRLRFTLASASTALPTIQHMWGTQPDVAAPLLDNSELALPLEFNNGVTATVDTMRTVSLTLGDASGPLANLTGLRVVFYDEPTPELFTTPRYQSANETTDGLGVLTFATDSALAIGGSGGIVIVAADGRHYAGSVVVS